METQRYDDIRPYRDEEMPEVINRLFADPQFCSIIPNVLPDVPLEDLKARLKKFTSISQFQAEIICPIVRQLAKKSTDSLGLSGFKYLDRTKAYTFVSNHRDIILDSAYLDIMLIEKGWDTIEIAIGNNLLVFPWISDLVRLNKSFLVKRGLPVRQQLDASIEMSSYMHETIEERNQSIWIAQREGRAKDANDRTQVSVLKMLNLGGSGSVLENLASMNIVPVAISYEYDPCDYLKAREMQQKRDNPDYVKSQKDDLINMNTGLMGYKGRVFYKVSPCISAELLKIDASEIHKNELLDKVAQLMDVYIHRNYHLYPGNYVAADMLDGLNLFSHCYSANEKAHFAAYLQKQLDKIDLEDKDEDFLRERMLEMYSNPLKNKLEAESNY